MAFNPNKSKSIYLPEATVTLVDPDTGEDVIVDGEPVTITVMGQANPKHLKAVEVLSKAQDKRRHRTTTLEETRADSLNFLASISVTSSNLEDDDGKPITTKEQFKTLYENNGVMWIRNQVSEFAGKDTNFLPK